MGCDGGITWMRTWSDTDGEIARRYIKPLGVLDDELRNEDWKYIKEHLLDRHVIYARYGTDLEHRGLLDVQEILQSGKLHNDKRTFEEIALNIATCEDWEVFQFSKLEKLLFKSLTYYSYNEIEYWSRQNYRLKSCEKSMQRILCELQHVKVCDWAHQLYASILDWDNCKIVQTWT